MPKKPRDWKKENEEQAKDAPLLVTMIKSGMNLSGYKIKIKRITQSTGFVIKKAKVEECGCVWIGRSYSRQTIFRCTEHRGFSRANAKAYRFEIEFTNEVQDG